MAGVVKSRLTPFLDPQQAALLYGAFLRDALLRARSVPDAAVCLIHPAHDDTGVLDALLPGGVTRIAEHGADVGAAMCEAFQRLFAVGAGSVVLTGADLPTLPASRIVDAFDALQHGDADCVLGPAEDGGYYLIGLREPRVALFEGVEWSTERVLAQTLERAAAEGLRVTLLEAWHDVDTPADLQRLMQDLADDPGLVAPATRQVLATLFRADSLALPAV